MNTTKKIWLTAGTVVMVAFIAYCIRFLFQSGVALSASISSQNIQLADSIFFEDRTPFATTWQWNMGDGAVINWSRGSYKFHNPGEYIVTLTVNKKYTDTFHIRVNGITHLSTIEDSLISIRGPQEGRQYENLVFRAAGKGATLFRWRFGDQSASDTREPTVIHAYDKPGIYTIELYTETVQYPSRFTVHISPAFKALDVDSNTSEARFARYDDDFRYHLQQIADHKDFKTHYYYLLKTYLCGNERAVVAVNGKLNDFFSYCAGLHYDEGILIQKVKVSVDADFKCVTKVDVAQQKNTQEP